MTFAPRPALLSSGTANADASRSAETRRNPTATANYVYPVTDSRSGEVRDTAGVIAPPLVIFGIPLLAGLAANWARALPIFGGGAGLLPGSLLAAIGLSLIAWGIIEFSRARTAVVPYRPTTAIVSSGPFRFTRNPLYLGFSLIYVGASLAADTYWPIFLLPIAIVVLQRGVIVREETYLERKFGAEYLGYKSRVRRWL